MANTVAYLVMLTIVGNLCCADNVNTVSVAGANVTMRCKTSYGNCSGVTWTAKDFAIYISEKGFLGDYGSRYSIDANSGCHLIIKDVQLTDTALLSCSWVKPRIASKSAYLIVLESEPKCYVSASAKTTEEGDRVDLKCEVTINGTNTTSVNWKDMKNVPPSTKSGKTVRLLHTVFAERPIVPSYECVVSFEVARLKTDVAANIPTASCKTPPIKILYGVKTAELTPSRSRHCPGSSVICSSDGNPPPTFKWQVSEMEKGQWKDVADVKGPKFTTGNESSLYYRCVASNVVKNITYTATSSSFRVNYHTESTGIGFGLGFGIGFIVALVLFFVVLFLLSRLRHLQIRWTSGNTPTGSLKSIVARSKKENDTIEPEAIYANLQSERDSHCYTSLAEEQMKRRQK